MHCRPHLFHNLPLSSQFLHQYQIILHRDRSARIQTTCLKLLCKSAQPGVELKLLTTSPMFHSLCPSQDWNINLQLRIRHDISMSLLTPLAVECNVTEKFISANTTNALSLIYTLIDHLSHGLWLMLSVVRKVEVHAKNSTFQKVVVWKFSTL